MRQFFWVCILIASLLGISACSEEQQAAKDVRDMLAGQKFVIVSLDGTSFPSLQDQSLYVQFDSTLKLSGHVCNEFSGASSFKNSVLQVPRLDSTNMLCSDEINGLERVLFTLLQNGAEVTLEAETLTLSSPPDNKTSTNGQSGTGAEPHIFVLQRENSVVAQ